MVETVTIKQKHVPKCPYCSQVQSGHAGNGVPSPGDISICAGCMNVGIFDHTEEGEITVRKPNTEAEAMHCGAALDGLINGL